MIYQHKQRQSCSRSLTTASRLRSPLRERHNTPAPPTPPNENAPPKENSLFPFPCPKEPVPDAPDFTELWKAVSMVKSSDVSKSNRSTKAYGDVLHRLGIDIETTHPTGSPGDVINLGEYQSPPTVEYTDD